MGPKHASSNSRSDDDLLKTKPKISSDEGWSVSLEGGSECLCWSSLALVDVGETKISLVEVNNSLSLDFLATQHASSDDLDSLCSGAVFT